MNVGLDEPWELPPERIDDYLEWVRVLRALPELEGREMLVWGDIIGGDAGAHPDAARRGDRLRVGLRRGLTRSTARAATYAEAGRPFWIAPGTSSWLTILGRITNMRGEQHRGRRRGARPRRRRAC